MASNPASQPIQELKSDTTTHSDGSESPQSNAEYVPNQAISAVIEQHQSSTIEDHDYTHWWGTVLLSDIRALPMRTMTIHTLVGDSALERHQSSASQHLYDYPDPQPPL